MAKKSLTFRRRMLYENICESKKIERLSARAETLYYRLLTKTDDFGNFYGEPSRLNSACFPLNKKLKNQAVKEWRDELIAVGLIVLYEFEDEEYVHFCEFEEFQTIKGEKQSRVPSYSPDLRKNMGDPTMTYPKKYVIGQSPTQNSRSLASHTQLSDRETSELALNQIKSNPIKTKGDSYSSFLPDETPSQPSAEPEVQSQSVQHRPKDRNDKPPDWNSFSAAEKSKWYDQWFPPDQVEKPRPAAAAASVAKAEPRLNGPFIPLKFAKENRANIGEFSAAEVQRVLAYHFKFSDKDYWRKSGIKDLDHLKNALPHMVKGVPNGFKIPGSFFVTKIKTDPNCKKCSGSGQVTIDHPAYPAGLFLAVTPCPCVKEVA